ncbi:MAG: hypothetical protein WCD79_13920 [Chthoniobacteraceae bacterium]
MTESQVYLRAGKSGKLVEASLYDEVTEAHLALWDEGWVPAMQAFCADRSQGQNPEDSHWDWRRKSQALMGLLGYHSFALLCQNELQGLMVINDITSARLPGQFGKPLVYIQFLATAPWNRPEVEDTPRFRGVGNTFVLAAIESSRDAGFKGRIGLHALPRAEPFYEEKCGLTRLGPDSSHQNLVYFEMTETQAEIFRQNH